VNPYAANAASVPVAGAQPLAAAACAFLISLASARSPARAWSASAVIAV